MLRSVLRVAPAAMRPAAVRRVVTRVCAAGAITAAGTTTASGGSTVGASNTRSRGVAHVSSSAAAAASVAAAKKHWSADGEGINAEQRALAKVQSTDPVERLSAATTRELLQSACTAPGVVDATLQAEVVASTVSPKTGVAAEEVAFLSKMEKEFGHDVLQVLRRQEWAVNIAATATKDGRDRVATLVCYYQEGTQRILFRRLTSA